MYIYIYIYIHMCVSTTFIVRNPRAARQGGKGAGYSQL